MVWTQPGQRCVIMMEKVVCVPQESCGMSSSMPQICGSLTGMVSAGSRSRLAILNSTARFIYFMKYSPDWPLEISASLRPANHDQGGRTWLTDMCETSALISAILRVIHPKLYISGRDTLHSMRGLDHLHPILGIWSLVFNVVTVLSN